MWSKNKVLEKIKVNKISFGFEIMLGSPRIIEIAGWAGFDFVQLDQEHAPFDFEAIENQIRAAENSGMSAFVRVCENNPKHIGRALEVGAHGIIVPQVVDAADVQRAIDAMYYAPRGKRECALSRAPRGSMTRCGRTISPGWTRKSC